MEKNERLLEIIKYLGITRSRFAQSIGMSPAGIYNVLDGKAGIGISRNLANKIVNVYPQFSYTWLLTGEGEMLKELLRENQILKELSDLKDKYIEVLEENRKLNEENKKLRQFPPAVGRPDAASREVVERKRKAR